MEPIDDLETLRNILRPMAERKLVIYLTPEGRRGTALTHGFHAPEELEKLRSQGAFDREQMVPVRQAAAATAQPETASLRDVVASLQARVGELAEQVRQIKESLGM
jgi:hypothetical protein